MDSDSSFKTHFEHATVGFPSAESAAVVKSVFCWFVNSIRSAACAAIDDAAQTEAGNKIGALRLQHQ